MIYECALVPLRPIELAPLKVDSGEEPEHLHFNGVRRGPRATLIWPPTWLVRDWGGYKGHKYHAAKYRYCIQPSLVMLRLSKQIRTEASAIFYGQEFRFSNSQGWHLLHKWLNLIGPKNQRLLRHITVTYPGVTSYYDQTVRNYHHITRNSPEGKFHAKNLMSTPISNPWQTKSSWVKIKKWLKKSDPSAILLSLTKLRTLNFVHFWPDRKGPSETRIVHPIQHATCSSTHQLKITMINLISVFGSQRVEVRSEAIYGGRVYESLSNPLMPEWDPQARFDQVKAFFDEVKASGWTIRDEVYDNHFTYPVSHDEDNCVDYMICKYNEEVVDWNYRGRRDEYPWFNTEDDEWPFNPCGYWG